MKKYTMADIAREANVAKSTVSRYFNGGYIKDDTRKRIQEVIERTNYEPSAAAQNLKLKRTKTIGIVVPTLTSNMTGRLLMRMDENLRQAGYSTIIVNTNHDPQREISAIEYLRSLRTDGIILIATNLNEEHQRLQSSSPIPFLVMGQKFSQGTSVIYDDYDAGFEMGRYAAKRNPSSVLYLGVSKFDDAVGNQRRKGVLDGLRSINPDLEIDEQVTSFEFNDAREMARQVLCSQKIPEMIICATDMIALACYKELMEKGLKIPEDVSLAGFGGYEMSELITPALTSIHFDSNEAGDLCARTIIDMIEERAYPKLQVVGYEFRKGGSIR